MVLNRLGNKSQMAEKIIPMFHTHETYVEMFFGTGSIFFSKGLSKYNVLNDLDSEVANLFIVIKDRHKELITAIELMPFSHDVLKYLKSKKETDEIWRAAKLLYVSNFTLMSKGDTLKCAPNNFKDIMINNIYETMKYLAASNVIWLNTDYSNVLDVMSSYRHEGRIFVYADPPYINTANGYGNNQIKKSTRWKPKDLIALVEYLKSYGHPFAISEFQSDDTLKIADDYGLNVNIIGERKNIKQRRVEILLTNYKVHNLF